MALLLFFFFLFDLFWRPFPFAHFSNNIRKIWSFIFNLILTPLSYFSTWAGSRAVQCCSNVTLFKLKKVYIETDTCQTTQLFTTERDKSDILSPKLKTINHHRKANSVYNVHTLTAFLIKREACQSAVVLRN